MAEINGDEHFDLSYYFDLSPDLLCIAGYDGYFKRINPAVANTLGYSKAELMAAPINSFVHPADKNRTAQKRDGLRRGESLLNFENRYLRKDGTAVWLSWTSVRIERDQVVFAIAKDITYRKQFEEFERISAILMQLHPKQIQRLKNKTDESADLATVEGDRRPVPKIKAELSENEQLWLNKFEDLIRQNISSLDLNLRFLSQALALSERQLFRQIKKILDTTPNNFIQVIRLQMAWEAIGTGKYKTVTEIANIAGYNSSHYFKKLFERVYGIAIASLIS